jgi:hypothetical protein
MMSAEELITEYLIRCRHEIELPRAEAKHRLLEGLAEAKSGEDGAAATSLDQKPRGGLARLAKQLIAGGQRLAGGTSGRTNTGNWNGPV